MQKYDLVTGSQLVTVYKENRFLALCPYADAHAVDLSVWKIWCVCANNDVRVLRLLFNDRLYINATTCKKIQKWYMYTKTEAYALFRGHSFSTYGPKGGGGVKRFAYANVLFP